MPVYPVQTGNGRQITGEGMFYSSTIDQQLYTEFMEQMKKLNASYIRAQRQKPLWERPTVKEIKADVDRRDIKGAAKCADQYINRKTRQWKRTLAIHSKQKGKNRSNYFSEEKIAIYTVITGTYDLIYEPYCRPDNCDYFVFTDADFDDSASTWQKREIPDSLKGLSDIEKNRYLKMHPQELFDAYKYSIYVDGNIQIVTDLTEYINKLGPVGIGAHLHPVRDCVYEEMQEVVRQGKERKEHIRRHAEYMKETGMPRHYGLLECNVIAREHHNSICRKIMEEWWQEFEAYSKRDQISLPHILFQNGIKVQEAGVLGDNVRTNPSFRIFSHTGSSQLPESLTDE